MYKDLLTEDNIHDGIPSASSVSDEDNTSQMVEMAAEQLANLIWDHWLYIQRQKKGKALNTSEA